MELSLEASRYSLGYAAFEAAYAGSYELLFASVYSAPLVGPIALVPRGAATSPVMLGPNITGETGGLVGYNELASGCFKRTNTGTATLPPGTLVTKAELNFSAQLSNPIYNGAITVQPSALFLLPCIKF